MPKTVMTRAEFARHRGCDRALITRWVKRGRLVLTEDNQVDVEASEARIDETADPKRAGEVRSRPGRGTRGQALDPIRAARTRNELAVAEARELDLAERRGELVRRDQAERAATLAAGAIAKALEAMPTRIGGRMAAMFGGDERQAIAVLDEEADALRKLIADELRRLVPTRRTNGKT